MSLPSYEVVKRALDVALAALALVLTAPLWVAAAAVIVVGSPGPIFFVQERVGRRQRPFRLIKFRTMHCQPSANSKVQDAAALVSVKDDPRVFHGGGLLRRWKIDELPQLVNVLAGSMSLVGPRPTVAADYARMTPDQRRRADVRPGITGLGQIRGGATVPWPVRLQWDDEYLRERSLGLDLRILAATVWVAMIGRAPGESSFADEWRDAA